MTVFFSAPDLCPLTYFPVLSYIPSRSSLSTVHSPTDFPSVSGRGESLISRILSATGKSFPVIQQKSRVQTRLSIFYISFIRFIGPEGLLLYLWRIKSSTKSYSIGCPAHRSYCSLFFFFFSRRFLCSFVAGRFPFDRNRELENAIPMIEGLAVRA